MVFELTAGTTPVVPSYHRNVMEITDVQTPGSFNPGETVTVQVTVDYDFDDATDVAPSIWNNRTQTFIATVEDTVTGQGTKTFDVEFLADEPDTAYFAVAYYIQGGDIVFTEGAGLAPFRLDGSTGSGIEAPSFELPDINLDDIKSQINDYIDSGLDRLNITVPDELTDIEEKVKEKTGIPGFPVEALVLGVALVYVTRRKS